jgi:hypothetical protein
MGADAGRVTAPALVADAAQQSARRDALADKARKLHAKLAALAPDAAAALPPPPAKA